MLAIRRVPTVMPFARQGITLAHRGSHSLPYPESTVFAALRAPAPDNSLPVNRSEVEQWRMEMAVWATRLARYNLTFPALADTARLALPELQHHEREPEKEQRGNPEPRHMRGDTLEALKERIHSKQVTVITGAGASKQLNQASPSWASLLEQVGTQCAELLFYRQDMRDDRDAWFLQNIAQPLQVLDYDTPAQHIQLAMSSLGHYNDYRSMVYVVTLCLCWSRCDTSCHSRCARACV